MHRKIRLVSEPLEAASTRLMTHPRIRDAYPEYLITVHCVIRASVPLMLSAHDRSKAMAPDHVAEALAPYLERHIEEERGHDEWVLEDLEALGIDRSEVLSRVPSQSVACMIGSQYYWTLHFHPVTLLGYLAVTEGYPTPPQLIEQLVRRTGLPRSAFRTLVEHAELDSGHGDEIDQMIDSLPLLREHEEAIGLSAMSSVELMARTIDEVCDSVETALV